MPISVYTPDGNRIVHRTSADFASRSAIPCCVHLMQYDQTLPIVCVELYLKGQVYVLPSGASVNIRVGKPDGTKVYNAVSGCNPARNAVYFEVTKQMAAAWGTALASLELVIDNRIAGSSYIALDIDRNPAQEDAIESSDEYKLLNEVIADAEAVISNPPKIQNGTWWIWDSAKKAYVDSGYSAGGGSGGTTEVFICTISGSKSTGYTCDKTVAEINTAYLAGKVVYAKDATRFMPLVSIAAPQLAHFCVALAAGVLVGYVVTGSGTVNEFSNALAKSKDIPTKLPNPNVLNIKVGENVTSYDGSNEQTIEIPDAAGGSGVFLVTFTTPTYDTGYYEECEVDKTLKQVLSAYREGKIVLARWGKFTLPLLHVYDAHNIIRFGCNYIPDPDTHDRSDSVTIIYSTDGDHDYGEVGYWEGDVLPMVTVADNGKFLRVVNGFWKAEAVPSAGGASF